MTLRRNRPGGSDSLSRHASCGAQSSTQSIAKFRPKLEVDEALHLPGESLPITVPPEFFYSGQAVDIDIFCTHHLFEAKPPMRASHAARFHPAVRGFADSEAGNEVVHHHGSSLNMSRDPLAALGIARPDAGGKTEF